MVPEEEEADLVEVAEADGDLRLVEVAEVVEMDFVVAIEVDEIVEQTNRGIGEVDPNRVKVCVGFDGMMWI